MASRQDTFKTPRSKHSRVDSSRKSSRRHFTKGSPPSDDDSSSSSSGSSSPSDYSQSDDSDSCDLSSASSSSGSDTRRSRRRKNRRPAKDSLKLFEADNIMPWVRSGNKARRSGRGKPFTVVGSRRSSNTVADALLSVVRLMDETCAEAKVLANSSSALLMAIVATGTVIEPDTAIPNYPGISYQALQELRAAAVVYANSDKLFSSSQKRTKCSRTSFPALLMNSVYQFLYSVPFFVCSFGDPQYLQSVVPKLKADRAEFDSYLTLYSAYHSAEQQVALLSDFQKSIFKLIKTVDSKAHNRIRKTASMKSMMGTQMPGYPSSTPTRAPKKDPKPPAESSRGGNQASQPKTKFQRNVNPAQEQALLGINKNTDRGYAQALDALHQLPHDKDERARILQRNICKHYFLHKTCPSQTSPGQRTHCRFPHISQADVLSAGLPLEEVRAILDAIPIRTR